MSRRMMAVSVLLLVQLVLSAWVLGQRQTHVGPVEPSPLLSFNSEAVTRVEVGTSGRSVSLLRQSAANGSPWRIAEGDLPVNRNQVRALLTDLQTLQVAWPVATSEASHARYRLTEDQHERYLRLYSDDQLLGAVYIGTAPETGRSYVRRSNDVAIHNVGLDIGNVPTNVVDWMDRTLVAADDVRAVNGADYAVALRDGRWHWAEHPDQDGDHTQDMASAVLNQNRVRHLAAVLETLSVRGIINTPGAQPTTTLVV